MDSCVTCWPFFMFPTLHRFSKLSICISLSGKPPVDKRGHGPNAKALDQSVKEKVREHISSFRARKSHYSLSKTSKVYLPSELNIKKLYEMFNTKYPDVQISYESYRVIFNTEFNIAFGYPRSDTCSKCDEYIHKVKDIDLKIDDNNNNDTNMEELLQTRRSLEVENTVHLKRADVFYERKRKARQNAEKNRNFEAICMDYQKNLPVPNKTTNDIYYKRQLTCISFNIHILSTKDSYFYCYDETVSQKGADDVASMLHDFFLNHLPASVRTLEIYCDSCAGQNKNYTIFRYIHWLIHTVRRFDSVKMIFPIRGHSYMECDKNFGLLNQKADAEVPADWWNELRKAREKPQPFKVIECERSLFKKVTAYITSTKLYKNTCPFPTRPVREFLCSNEFNHQLVHYRDSWNGQFSSAVILNRGKKPESNPREMCRSRMTPIPLKKAKYVDLQSLKRFCSETAQIFYDSLTHDGTPVQEKTGDSESE